jgi:hypothetical protein
MARALVIEEESGACSGFLHPHNGYYAGDFTQATVVPASSLGLELAAPQTGASATMTGLRRAVAHVDDHTHALAP